MTTGMVPPAGGMLRQTSNLSKLSLNSGKIRLICPICTTDFVRPVAWAKRVDVNYCGRGCSAIGRTVRIECFCSVCQAAMMLTPTNVERKTTCGPVCSSIKKRSRGANTRKYSWVVYKHAMKEVTSRAVCVKCDTTVGPWVVRGIEVDTTDENMPVASAESASLWCKHCHLTDVAPIGGVARQKQRMMK